LGCSAVSRSRVSAPILYRHRLQSLSTAQLLVPRIRCSTIGGRSFHVAAARAWNGLPSHVMSLASLQTFKRTLKTDLFTRSFPATGSSDYQLHPVVTSWPQNSSEFYATLIAIVATTTTLTITTMRRQRACINNCIAVRIAELLSGQNCRLMCVY